MKITRLKKMFLLILVLLFLLPGCSKKQSETITVYCLKEIEYSGRGKVVYNYDTMGNVLEYPHASTGRTVCTYDDQNNTLTSDYYLSDALIEGTAYTYNEQSKILTKKVTEQSGISEYTYTYDEAGNLVSETIKAANQIHRKIVYTYTFGKDGTILQSVSTYYRLDTQTGKTVETFDSAGRLLLREYYSGTDDTPEDTDRWVYDSKGNLVSEEYNDTYTKETTWEYDRKGRLVSECTYRDGVLYNRKLYTYDKKGNLLETRDDLEVTGETKRQYYRTEYTYDRKGNKLSEKAFYSFNGNWEVFRNHFTYTYDENGNLLEETRLSKEGNFVTGTIWTYYDGGKVHTKNYKASKDHNQISTYDEHGNLISYFWSHSNDSAEAIYRYVTFQLPPHLAEKVRLQQKAVFEALEYSPIG